MGLILQFMSWVTVERGRNVGSRPDEENDGYCRALCLIISELKRQDIFVQTMKPLFNDYNRETIVQKRYEQVAQIGAKKSTTFDTEVIT